jgi:hypothetical protein
MRVYLADHFNAGIGITAVGRAARLQLPSGPTQLGGRRSEVAEMTLPISGASVPLEMLFGSIKRGRYYEMDSNRNGGAASDILDIGIPL